MQLRLFSIVICACLSFAANCQNNTIQLQQIPYQNLGNKVIGAKPVTGGSSPAAKPSSSGSSSFETVADDPFKARIYTLKNGLKIYLSVNKNAPRIQSLIAVKAGSKFDPPQTTGLAHYLEHMMFKGSHDFGTANWTGESVLLDSISAYFEYHKNENDPAKKTALYAKIDSNLLSVYAQHDCPRLNSKNYQVAVTLKL